MGIAKFSDRHPVQQGSGIEDGCWDAWAFYNYGLIAVGKELLGGDGGRKKDGFVASETVFKHILDKGADESLKEPIVAVLSPGGNNLWSRLTQDVLTGGLYETTLASAKQIAEWIDGWVDPANDDYKVRSLACTGNVLGDKTYAKLKSRRSYDPLGTGQKTIYEHLPLMNLALYDLDCKNMKYGNDYKSERKIYEDLLNSAPACGPSGKCSAGEGEIYHYDWSETSRCVWPEKLRPQKTDDENKDDGCRDIIFCGMDYMMLYNLYCIAFSREQYVTTTNNTSTINTVVISKPITSNNVTNSAPCVTLLPGFEASGSRNYTAKAVALPSDFVDGTQYRKIDYPDCGCNYLTKNKSLATTSNSNTVRKTMSYMANKSNLSEDNEGKDVFGIDQEEQPITTIENDESEDENPIDLCSEQLSVSVAPNPASDVLQLEVDNYKELPIIVDIVSLDGNSKQSLELYEPYARIDVNGWSSGIYIVRVKSGGVLVSQMVMVKH